MIKKYTGAKSFEEGKGQMTFYVFYGRYFT